jgi:hypothetical protein
MPVPSAALRPRPYLEAPTRHLQGLDGQPVPPLAGRNRVHWRDSNMIRGAPQISSDLFGEALDHDAPAHAQRGVPVVHFEGEPGLWDEVELGTWSGAEHDDPALHRVVDRKDLGLALGVEGDPAQVAGSKQKKAFIGRQHLDRLIRWHASVHAYRMNRELIRSSSKRPVQIGTFGTRRGAVGFRTLKWWGGPPASRRPTSF